MKKLLIFIVLSLAYGTTYAQEIKEKDLLGKWNILIINMAGIERDYRNPSFTIPQDYFEKNEISEENIEAAKMNFEMVFLMFSGNYIIFEKNNKSISKLGSESVPSNYYLTKENGMQYINFENEGKDGMLFQVEIKDGLLYMLTELEGDTIKTVYKKE